MRAWCVIFSALVAALSTQWNPHYVNVFNYTKLKNTRNCELNGLHDLNQGSTNIRSKIVNFTNHLTDAGVAGFRIDAPKHMSRPFLHLEVIYNSDEAASSSDYTYLDRVTEFKHSYDISEDFMGRNPSKYLTTWSPNWIFIPSEKAGDILTPKKSRIYKMAFMLAHTYAIPRVMSSFYFNDTAAGSPADKQGKKISPISNSDLSCTNGSMCEYRWRQIYNIINFWMTVAGRLIYQFQSINITPLVKVSTAPRDPHYWDNRDVMVHLFEWKWNDIASECENFLGPRGFAGVQISPPNENVVIGGRPWWERYQPVSYVLKTRSGDEDAFRDMTERCNAVGVRIYADAVINHMSALATSGYGTAGNSADYDNKDWPAVPYTWENINSPVCLIENYQDANEVRNCELLHLADLNQGSEDTRAKIAAYMNHLIDLGVAGFRIDAAKHMWPADLANIYSRLNTLNTSHGFTENTVPFIFQEVIDYGGEAVTASEYTGMSIVTEFKHGMELSNAFKGNNTLKWLVNWGEAWGLLDSADALVFIDNHDTQREGNVLTYKNAKPYKMAIAFMLAHTYGMPNIISSYAFTNSDDPPPADSSENLLSPVIYSDNTCGNGYNCEHRWRQIYNMVEFRNTVKGTGVNDWWDNDNNQIAFCRGNSGFIAFNLDSYDLKKTLQTCLPAGIYCDVISGSLVNNVCTGKSVYVGSDQTAYIEILTSEDDGVLAIHANSKIEVAPDLENLENLEMLENLKRLME